MPQPLSRSRLLQSFLLPPQLLRQPQLPLLSQLPRLPELLLCPPLLQDLPLRTLARRPPLLLLLSRSH